MSDASEQRMRRPAPPAGWARGAVIGVLGAGTMGAGIAQLAARSGAQTLLYDPIPEALRAGLEQRPRRARAEKRRAGALSAEEAAAAAERLQPVEDLERAGACELVIEAVPERLELKHEIYGRLSRDRRARTACWRRTPPRCS